jgi:transposase
MLSWEEDVQAQALRQQGWSISAIARHLQVDRKTVRADHDRPGRQANRRHPRPPERPGDPAVPGLAEPPVVEAFAVPRSPDGLTPG